MESEERQFLLTSAWLFARHGQTARARVICEALVEGDPRDGVSAAALAELLLEDAEPERALAVLRAADYPTNLQRAEALLEARALSMLGRKAEAARRWAHYVELSKGRERKWIA